MKDLCHGRGRNDERCGRGDGNAVAEDYSLDTAGIRGGSGNSNNNKIGIGIAIKKNRYNR